MCDRFVAKAHWAVKGKVGMVIMVYGWKSWMWSYYAKCEMHISSQGQLPRQSQKERWGTRTLKGGRDVSSGQRTVRQERDRRIMRLSEIWDKGKRQWNGRGCVGLSRERTTLNSMWIRCLGHGSLSSQRAVSMMWTYLFCRLLLFSIVKIREFMQGEQTALSLSMGFVLGWKASLSNRQNEMKTSLISRSLVDGASV